VLDIPQLKGFQTVVAPTDIPTNIPPINLQEHFDPKDYSGTGSRAASGRGSCRRPIRCTWIGGGGTARGIVGSAAPVSRPVAASLDPGAGPGAGDIDTTGRAEPPSVKVIQSPTPGFDQPAKNYVLRALFRPARVHGRAVRVLIISRSISRSSVNPRGARVR